MGGWMEGTIEAYRVALLLLRGTNGDSAGINTALMEV